MTTTDAPTARIGNLNLYKTGPATFVLTTLTGVTAGTYPTANAAEQAAYKIIAARHAAVARPATCSECGKKGRAGDPLLHGRNGYAHDRCDRP